MQIEVAVDGALKIDGVSTEPEELTQQFLEKLVEDSLQSQVTYDIQGDMPIAEFFRTLDKGTREGSQLRKLKDEADRLEREAISKGQQLVDDVLAES